MNLLVLVQNAGVTRARVLRTHYASLGAADLVFEQEDEDMATLEAQLSAVTAMPEFQQWSQRMSEFLSASPKREVYMGVE